MNFIVWRVLWLFRPIIGFVLNLLSWLGLAGLVFSVVAGLYDFVDVPVLSYLLLFAISFVIFFGSSKIQYYYDLLIFRLAPKEIELFLDV